MIEKLDMDKLQKLVYYINNVKMGTMQRDELNRVIIGGIIRGEIDTDELFIGPASPGGTGIEDFVSAAAGLGLSGWIKSAELYQEYVAYCNGSDRRPETLGMFGKLLVALGVERKKRADANCYYIGDRVGQSGGDVL